MGAGCFAPIADGHVPPYWAAVPKLTALLGAYGDGTRGDSKVKSKEPKQSKEKKSEAKPRKASEKGKRVQVQAATDPQVTPHAFASDQPTNVTNGSTNGAASPSAAVVEMVAIEIEPPEELIRMRAYELFVDRGCEHGHHLEDWLDAERE